MKKKIKVSVIINCLNGEKFLKQAINSVLKQDHKNLEIIFWDNHSTDNSIKQLKEIKTYRKIKEIYKILWSGPPFFNCL